MTSIARVLIAVLLCAAPLGASLADPPPWAPAHGARAKHRYVYYPAHQIYYEPETRLWFWVDGDNWQFGASLPVHYRQYTTGGIRIELDTDRPYTQHADVVERYGAGKAKPAGGRGKGPPGRH